MNPLCWSLVRNKTREAVLSGIQDAFDVVDRTVEDPGAPGDGILSSSANSSAPEPTAEPSETKSQAVWFYIRRRTCTAVLAGMREAITGQEASEP